MVSSNKYIRFSFTLSYNPTVVNNVYAAISQNTQNAVASAKNAVVSVQNALSYADDCVDRIGYSVGSFLFRSDAYSIYFSGSAYLGVGVTFSAELGHMKQYGGFVAASASFVLLSYIVESAIGLASDTTKKSSLKLQYSFLDCS